jgi:hypothetical protein
MYRVNKIGRFAGRNQYSGGDIRKQATGYRYFLVLLDQLLKNELPIAVIQK